MISDKCNELACIGGKCRIDQHKVTCECLSGYELVNNICEDINECSKNPCPINTKCKNNMGSYACECRNGTIKDENSGTCRLPGLCYSDKDCSDTATCHDKQCVNPCDKIMPCGLDANCVVAGHNPICECPPGSQGDPYVKCAKLECIKDNDCLIDEACVNYKCKNSCDIPRACGKNALCAARNHIGQCSCVPGYTGDPVLGCVPIQYCTDDSRCSTGTKCVDNLCVGKCNFNIIASP